MFWGGAMFRRVRLGPTLLFLGVIGVVGQARPQPLTELRFFLDEQPMIQIGPVIYTDDLYLAPVEDMMAALIGSGVKVEDKGDRCEIFVQGNLFVRIPLGEEPADAEVYAQSAGGSIRKVPLSQSPIKLKDVPDRLMMDMRDLGAILGVTVDIERDRVSLYSPAFWCRKLGLGEQVATNRILRNAGQVPEFGISPPAETHILWVRPGSDAFVQMYAIVDDKVTSFFQRSVLPPHEFVTFPRAGYRPWMKPAGNDRPAYGEAQHFNYPPGTFGAYVAIITTKDLGGDDPLEAIRTGRLGDGEWGILGFRQRVRENPVEFVMHTVAQGESAESIAKQYKMHPSLLLGLNGIREAEASQIRPGRRLIVVRGIRASFIEEWLNPRFEILGLYEVKTGDTVASLCRKWNITEDVFFDANTFAQPGYRLEPGELVNMAKMKDLPGPSPAEATGEPVGELGLTSKPTAVRKTSDASSAVIASLPRDQVLTVVASVEGGGLYLVSFDLGEGEMRGYVPAEAVDIPSRSDATSGGPVAEEALKWIGTPYDWGGNNLPKGIDCSHFVAQVLNRAGRPVPSAPVVNQERYGEIVHLKPGTYRRNGRNYVFRGPMRPLSTLQAGDRVIIQYDPLNDRSGSRHTGVFVGSLQKHPRFGNVKYAVVHASSRQGVTVCDLVQNRFMWQHYRYTVRDTNVAASSRQALDALVVEAVTKRLVERR